MCGLISELLKDLGTYAFFKHELINLVSGGKSSSKHSFKSYVGTGSSSQDLHGDAEIIFFSSLCVTGLNSTILSAVISVSIMSPTSSLASVLTLIWFLFPSIY